MSEWQRLTPGDEDTDNCVLYQKWEAGYWIRTGFQDDGELHYSAYLSGEMLTHDELAALPPVKARDERIAKLEIACRQAIEYIKDLIADADEEWRGDSSATDSAIEAIFDGEQDDKILKALGAALEDINE